MRVKRALIFAVSIWFLSALAQNAPTPTVTAVTDPIYGVYLADGDGRPLYMFSGDPKGESTCVDECAINWPPLIATPELTTGPGVAGSLLAKITRPDEVEQVTYFEVPLYYFAQDTTTGEVNGQGINGEWFLVSPFGSPILPPKVAEPEPLTAEEQLAEAELTSIIEAGTLVFSDYCAGCHGSRGEGGVGPRLAGARLEDNRRVIRQVLNGGGHMPGFRAVLDDERIASVVTYIRKSWSNDFPSVAAEEVMSFR